MPANSHPGTYLTIMIDDPRAGDIRALFERHLQFAASHKPSGDVHALDAAGLLDPAVTVFSCRAAGDLLAVAALKRLDARHAELKSMHTAEAARGRGVGRAMLAHLIGVARDRGFRRLSLKTGSQPAFAPARSLYASAGFTLGGPFSSYRPSDSSTFMTLSLDDPAVGRGAALPRRYDPADVNRSSFPVASGQRQPCSIPGEGNDMPVHDDRSDVTRFGHVDATGDAESLIAFLDTANALAGLRAAKQVLLDQLRLAQARSVLDVGCGTGADLISIAERLPPGGRAAGIDVSEAMIAEARRRASGLDRNLCFDSGDAANLPYEDASFGACRAATVLQHVPDADQVIREMIRVTRPGGRVAALEFDQDSTMLDHPDRDTTRVITQTFGDAMANGWAGRQLPRLFRQAGLTDLSVTPVVNLGEPAMFQAMLRPHVDRLCTDNILTSSQADDWWHALERQAADGHFLAGAVIFVVAATRPDGRTGLAT